MGRGNDRDASQSRGGFLQITPSRALVVCALWVFSILVALMVTTSHLSVGQRDPVPRGSAAHEGHLSLSARRSEPALPNGKEGGVLPRDIHPRRKPWREGSRIKGRARRKVAWNRLRNKHLPRRDDSRMTPGYTRVDRMVPLERDHTKTTSQASSPAQLQKGSEVQDEGVQASMATSQGLDSSPMELSGGPLLDPKFRPRTVDLLSPVTPIPARQPQHDVSEGNSRSKHEDIFEWATGEGATVNVASASFSRGDEYVRGAIATKQMGNGSVLVELPTSLVLTPDVARQSAIGDLFDDEDCQCVWTDEAILTYFVLWITMFPKQAGDWGHYGKYLADTKLPMPVFMTTADFQHLVSSHHLDVALVKDAMNEQKLRATALRKYVDHVRRRKPFFKFYMLTEKRLLRAYMLFNSRYWRMPFRNRDGVVQNIPFLTPVVDMLNTEHLGRTSAECGSVLQEGSGIAFRCTVNRPVNAGEEVVVPYARLCKEEYMAQHGVYMESAPHCERTESWENAKGMHARLLRNAERGIEASQDLPIKNKHFSLVKQRHEARREWLANHLREVESDKFRKHLSALNQDLHRIIGGHAEAENGDSQCPIDPRTNTRLRLGMDGCGFSLRGTLESNEFFIDEHTGNWVMRPGQLEDVSDDPASDDDIDIGTKIEELQALVPQNNQNVDTGSQIYLAHLMEENDKRNKKLSMEVTAKLAPRIRGGYPLYVNDLDTFDQVTSPDSSMVAHSEEEEQHMPIDAYNSERTQKHLLMSPTSSLSSKDFRGLTMDRFIQHREDKPAAALARLEE